MVIVGIKTEVYLKVVDEKNYLNQCLNRAVDDAMLQFIEDDGIDGLEINKERVIEDFFSTLYTALNIAHDPEVKEEVSFFIPIISITAMDGFYVYYTDEYKENNQFSYFKKQWSEKYPYYHEDEDFIYRFTLSNILTLYDKNRLLDPSGEKDIFTLDFHDLIFMDKYQIFRNERPYSFLLDEETFQQVRKDVIISSIEKKLKTYCHSHNKIGKQLGISYEFHIPVIDNSEWIRTIDSPGMICLFQGYPLQTDTKTLYNRFVISGAQVRKIRR